MKLYTFPRAPNPRRVEIFVAEKELDIAREIIDLGQMEQRQDAFKAVNPLQRVPVLELDDGSCIAESIAICRYLEARHPEPCLFGRTGAEQATVEMWQRRIELELLLPVSYVFRHLHPAMAKMENPQVPAWGDANKPRVAKVLRWLDKELAGRDFIAGDSFTVADITALVAVDFLKPARLAVPDECADLRRWHAAVSARPSVARPAGG